MKEKSVSREGIQKVVRDYVLATMPTHEGKKVIDAEVNLIECAELMHLQIALRLATPKGKIKSWTTLYY